MLIDSGSDLNIITKENWQMVKEEAAVSKAFIYSVKTEPWCGAQAYGGTQLQFSHSFEAQLSSTDENKPDTFAKVWVAKTGQTPLLGFESAQQMRLLKVGPQVNAIVGKTEPFPAMPGVEVEFDIDESVTPVCQNYYNVPAAFRQAAIARLREMEALDIIERIDKPSRWLSGMSAVPKGKSGDFRLVVNMRAPNKAIRRQYYSLPTIESIQTKLHGSKVFTKLDLTNAFHHLILSEKSRELTTFMGPDGAYRFKRLVFGVNCAPEVFQRHMERVLTGIKGVIVYIDDIMIHSDNIKELREITKEVMDKLKKNNLTINGEKCEFEKSSLTFLGQEVSEKGMNIGEEKVRDIKSFREPKSPSELKSFLGLASYVGRYVNNLSTVTAAMREASKAETFQWGEKESASFNATKNAIINETVTNGFYCLTDKTELYTDAGPDAVGAVLTQTNVAGKRRIISFASRALNETEKKYPQIQKEALGVVWGVERFYYYLLGRPFIIKTDAAGLAYIFDRDDKQGKMVLKRAEGFALRLSAFDFKIEYVSGMKNIADPSSRLCQMNESTEEYSQNWPNTVMQVKNVEAAAPSITFGETVQLDSGVHQETEFNVGFISPAELRWHGANDDEYKELIQSICTDTWQDDMKDYERKKDTFHVIGGAVSSNLQIVVPRSLRPKALHLAHKGHPGIAGMLSILRGRVWWPGMDGHAKRWVKLCEACTLTANKDPPVPMARSLLPSAPMEKLAIDFYGPIAHLGNILILVVVCCYSRYIWLRPVASTNYACTVRVFEEIFGVFGIPGEMRSDNGPPFSGGEYAKYAKDRGISLSFSTPYFPQQNGLAERYMQLVKKGLNIANLEGVKFTEALRDIERAHNSARHGTTKVIPEEVMFGRKIRGRLPLLEPMLVALDDSSIREKDWNEKMEAKTREDKKRRARETEIEVGDTVVVLNNNPRKGETNFGPKKYNVTKIKNGDMELMAVCDGSTIKRNVAHAKKIYERYELNEQKPTNEETTEVGKELGNELDPHDSETARDGRPARSTRMPQRFNDYIVGYITDVEQL